MTLLEISPRKHAPRDPALAPRSECVPRDLTWQVFLNQLSWLCGYDKGGDSTNSIAVEGTPEGSKYWLAANFDEKKKGFEHLKKVLGMLAELSTLPRDKQRQICDRSSKDSIDFSERKFNTYEKSLKTAIHFAEKSINQEEEDSLGRYLPSLPPTFNHNSPKDSTEFDFEYIFNMPTKTEMSKDASKRIQSSQATGGKDMSSRGFASRAQSAGDRNPAASGQTTSGRNNQQGGGGGNTGSNHSGGQKK